jgi:hypothetical protein
MERNTLTGAVPVISGNGDDWYLSRPGEDRVIHQIVILRKAGAAMDTIAETLNAEGVNSRSGGKWHGSSVRNVLLRVGA